MSINISGHMVMNNIALGTVLPWSAGDFSPALWLDASDVSTFTISDTNKIDEWRDKSGNARHAQPDSSGQRPDFDTNWQNGMGGVYVDGTSSKGLIWDNTLEARTMFVVHRWVDETGEYRHFFRSTDFFHGGGSYGGTKCRLFYGSMPNSAVKNGLVRFDGTDGGIPAQIHRSTIPSVATFQSTANADFQGTGHTTSFANRAFYGWYGEILAYTSVLTTAQIEQIEGYLSWKWGMVDSLADYHPYKSAPPPAAPSVTDDAAFLTAIGPRPKVWLDGADATTVILDGNSKVEEWQDKSGDNRHAVQTTASRRPTYSTSWKNGLNAVYLAGDAAQHMQWPVSGWSGRTTFIVHEWDTPGDGQYRHFISESGSFHGDNGTKVFSGSYGGKMAYNGTGRVNGTAVTMSTLNKDIVPNMLQMTFTAQAPYDGLASNDATRPSRTFWGHFAEVLVYEEVLTTTQIEDIEGYLAWKWDFVSELPPTHPYKSSPP